MCTVFRDLEWCIVILFETTECRTYKKVYDSDRRREKEMCIRDRFYLVFIVRELFN